MKIYYQGIPGAYSHIASNIAKEKLGLNNYEITGLNHFENVRKSLQNTDIAVLPIENSYAGSIHTNLYNFLKYKYTIIAEIFLPIQHYLLAKTDNIENIQKAYSHPQALAQCFNFLEQHHIQAIQYADTAKSAEFVASSQDTNIASIASKLAGEIYNLKTIQSNIQDQIGNTTRFIVITPDRSHQYTQATKTSILFQARHIPASLYKCLGAFATNGINLSKIESLPSQQDPFTYYFRLDFDSSLDNATLAIQELKYFTQNITILGQYSKI